jgi:glycosyltransferase involved in cell wall biosynthesis
VNTREAKKLSAVIITKNEERNIGKCLASLQKIADEILVLDSDSDDNTAAIARANDAVVFSVEWKGYAATKNHGNNLAANDWILSIDADEVVSPELEKSILEWKIDKTDDFGEFSRLTNYCGYWIRHGGWYPDVKIRIFNRHLACWEGDFVHEVLKFAPAVSISRLSGDILHYSFHSVSQHSSQVNRYSSLAAREKMLKGKKGNMMKLIFSPPWSFFQMYFLKTGFLDGKAGFIIAIISAHARFLRYAKMIFKDE